MTPSSPTANFVEPRHGEVRRIPIPRTRVNKGKKKDLSVRAPQKRRGSARIVVHYCLEQRLFLLDGQVLLLSCKPLSSVETFSSAVTP
jgi:hypothetical protein